MADTANPEETPQSPFQNGVRTSGRAFNSSNWRMKSDEKESPHTTNTSRAAFSRPGPHVPRVLAEGRRLYVGNMPYTAKSEDVEALFSEFPIERIDMAIDPLTGRNPSYCFVDLTSKEQAARAMAELDGCDLQGRPVRIKPGVAKSADQQQQQRSSPFATDRWRRGDQPNVAKINSDSSRRVYVGGLPRVTDVEGIQSNMLTFFQGYNVENVSKLFAPHPAKRFEPGEHYYLFIDFSSAEEAQAAMETLNGQQGPWGGPLRVQRARGPAKSDNNNTSDAAAGVELSDL